MSPWGSVGSLPCPDAQKDSALLNVIGQTDNCNLQSIPQSAQQARSPYVMGSSQNMENFCQIISGVVTYEKSTHKE